MREVRVSAAVIHRDGRIFAAKRGYGEWKGFWEFPGGKHEEGESGEEALRREIREELGAEIEAESLLCTVRYQYPSFLLVMDCYVSRVVSGELTLTEHEECRWLPPGELDSVEWLPADLIAVDELRKNPSVFQ